MTIELRYSRFLAAIVACLAVVGIAAPAHAATAKKTTSSTAYPVVTKISPMKLGVGDVMTITGKNFRPGKNKNTVVFKRDGARAIFLKVTTTATATKIRVTVPAKLLPFLLQKSGTPQSTRFRIRILAKRLGKAYTAVKSSPMIGPTAVAVGSASDCDGDGIDNAKDTDDDNDLIADTTETALKLDPCKRDTDGDGMSDGWEYTSAVDRNGGKAVPAPSAKPYPNALNPKDGELDQDGDGLSNQDEYAAWATYGENKLPLSYSGGNPTSAGRAPVPAELAYMDRDGNGYLSDLERDADGDGFPNMDEDGMFAQTVSITEKQDASDPRYYDFGLFSSLYIEEVVKKTRQDPETTLCEGINQVPFYCSKLTVNKVDPLDWLNSDSDGDAVRDDADDIDHDDVSNMTEYREELATPFASRHFAQLDACYPSTESRFCLIGTVDIDKDGLANSVDTDDDGDLLPDSLETSIGTDPLRFDSDNDGVDDGFEYYSALDLNSFAVPYPAKRPYPNALFADAENDYDQDSLTLKEEYQAWKYGGRSVPLTTYSDGDQSTGPDVAAPSDPTAAAALDQNSDGKLSDDERDVDSDGLSNFDETHGRMHPEWWDAYIQDFASKLPPDVKYSEAAYPGPAYVVTSFVDPDTDGDGIKDGADDQDHDGYTNAFEVNRPGMQDGSNIWFTTYVSYQSDGSGVWHAGSNPLARVQPFNPCKPVYSSMCHSHPPLGYYPPEEDWRGPPAP
jgi:hypothetical protein